MPKHDRALVTDSLMYGHVRRGDRINTGTVELKTLMLRRPRGRPCDRFQNGAGGRLRNKSTIKRDGRELLFNFTKKKKQKKKENDQRNRPGEAVVPSPRQKHAFAQCQNSRAEDNIHHATESYDNIGFAVS